MKKMKNLVYVSAIALLNTFGLTACSSSDDAVADEGLTPQVPGEVVKTQFSISLPSQMGGMRMTSATVQEAGTLESFRGMSDIVLIPYSNATDRSYRYGGNITFTSMIKPNEQTVPNSIPAGSQLSGSTAVLYNDVDIPVGTSGFLFYGKATGTDGYANGALTATGLDGESTGIGFSLNPIQATPDLTKGGKLADYVTSIAQAKASDNDTWAGSTDGTNLRQLYNNFTSMTAGASSYVQAAVQELYTTLKGYDDEVANAIKIAITNEEYATEGEDGKLTFTAKISGYPADNNSMPDGAAALVWEDDPQNAGMKKATPVSTTAASTLNIQAMDKIVYPASLYYFVNSGLKTSHLSQVDAYTTTNNWTTILANYISGESVVAATRSVAITNPIQYAVGRLDVKVNKLSETTTYYDRRGDVVTIPAAGYTLTGVLIGGQKDVDYKFEPTTETGATEYTIYDKTIDGTLAVTTTADAGTNYTLALETETEKKVKIALEFKNNGDDFVGVDGVVKTGCKFYMVAELDPAIDTDGSKTGKKVFKQDFKTIANFTFGTGSANPSTPGGLGNAYVTIPDLRISKLELGFSVNLDWQEGLTFNEIF